MLPHTPEAGYTRYSIKNGGCKSCPLRESCLGSSKLPNKRVYRARYQDEFDALHKRSGTKHFRQKLRQRSTKIEGVFGEGKENHCLGRAIYRGRAKMQMQVYMISIVHNLKKMARGASTRVDSFVARIIFIIIRPIHGVISFANRLSPLHGPILSGIS